MNMSMHNASGSIVLFQAYLRLCHGLILTLHSGTTLVLDRAWLTIWIPDYFIHVALM